MYVNKDKSSLQKKSGSEKLDTVGVNASENSSTFTASKGQALDTHSILNLQNSVGNQTVQRMLADQKPTQAGALQRMEIPEEEFQMKKG